MLVFFLYRKTYHFFNGCIGLSTRGFSRPRVGRLRQRGVSTFLQKLGKPRSLPEVSSTMVCGVMGDTVPPRCDFFVVAIMYTVYLEMPCARDLTVLKKYLKGHLAVTLFS